MKNKESFREFKKKALHEKEDLFAVIFLSPITIRVAYLIKKWNLNISPNQVTLTRLFALSPLIIVCLFLAPILGLKIFYLMAIILSYLFLLSDWLDGQIARGMNTVSEQGDFLDALADRWCTIICFVSLFSIGMWFNNSILIYGAISLFVLKTFHMMVITKIFYFGKEEGLNNQKIFAGEDAAQIMGITALRSFLSKINSFLKIKRWGCGIGGSERYFVTIMVPLLFLIFNVDTLALYFGYFLLFFFFIFLLIRIKNLLQSYV